MLQMLSRVFLIQALAPIFGPILGSQVVSIGPWQYVFLIVGFFGLVTSFLVWYFLDETLPKAQRRASTAIGILRGFGNVLRDRVYFGLLLTSALQMAALFGYLNVVSYLYQEEFGLSEAEFGLVFALNALAMYLGIQVGGLLSKRFRVQWLMVGFLTVGALTGFYLMATTGSGLWFAEIGFIVLVFVFGAPAAATPTLALLNHGSEAGTASALMGSTNFLATTVFAAIYSTLSLTETFDVGVLIAANFGLATLVLLFVVRPWTIPDLRKPQELPEESH
jgi:DHA1 family bicyclomycin/chloramphenicol resistance-like MFS transporter